MKQKLDERQQQVMGKIGSAGFCVMFFVCAAAIVIQMIWGDGSLKGVAGETAALLAGGIVYLAGCMKSGIWTGRKNKAGVLENLIYSVVFAGIFSVIFGLVIQNKVSQDALAGKYVGFFFLGISVIGFLVLTVMAQLSKAEEHRQEKKYLDE
ncbi:MAG: DUF6773 family protein [Blautia sp.]|jgi:hypothetical protein